MRLLLVAMAVACLALVDSGVSAREPSRGRKPAANLQALSAAEALPRLRSELSAKDEFRLRPLLLPAVPADDLVVPAISVPGLYPAN